MKINLTNIMLTEYYLDSTAFCNAISAHTLPQPGAHVDVRAYGHGIAVGGTMVRRQSVLLRLSLQFNDGELTPTP